MEDRRWKMEAKAGKTLTGFTGQTVERPGDLTREGRKGSDRRWKMEAKAGLPLAESAEIAEKNQTTNGPGFLTREGSKKGSDGRGSDGRGKMEEKTERPSQRKTQTGFTG
jgi:hypothetical protein